MNKKFRLEEIIQAVADYCYVTTDEIKSKKQTDAIAYARRLYYYLSLEFAKENNQQIASFVNQRGNASYVAYNRVKLERMAIHETKKTIDGIIKLLFNEL